MIVSRWTQNPSACVRLGGSTDKTGNLIRCGNENMTIFKNKGNNIIIIQYRKIIIKIKILDRENYKNP